MAKHIKPLFVLFLPTIAISLYKYMDKIMIGMLSDKVQLGLYENAEKVILLPLTIISSFGTVMIPRISNMLAGDDRDNTIRYTKLSTFYVMCLAYALTFGFAATAQIFAPVYWGAEFTLSGTIMMGLSLTIPFVSFASIIRTQYLIPAERDREYVWSVFGGAISNLVLNTLLIPKLGAMGATIGTIAAETVVCIMQCVSVRKMLPLWKMIRQSIPFLFFGISMFAVVYTMGIRMGTGIVTLLVQIAVGVIIYVAETAIYLTAIKEPLFISMIARIKKRS